MALQNNKALQFRPGYVACSFTFLLLGLASLSSSINLLVLRFMILSLEEEEEEEELQVRLEKSRQYQLNSGYRHDRLFRDVIDFLESFKSISGVFLFLLYKFL